MNIEYTDTIKPRIYDINYGGHVGHVELINLLHEIRIRFLNKYSLKETDINGHALLVRNLNITYKNQVFWDNELKIQMKPSLEGAKITFYYRVFNTTSKNEAAEAEIKMVLLDKEKEKITKPGIFFRMLENDNSERKY